MWVQVKYLDVALQAGDNLNMWRGCWGVTVLGALSRQIIVIADPSICRVLGGMIQRFEVIAVDMNVCDIWNITREH